MVKTLLIRLLAVVILMPLTVSAANAPGFTLSTGKSTISLNAYRGKLVYVDFWASWCDPCRKSFPWMSELQKRYPQDLKIIAINLDQDRGEAEKFLQQTRPAFTIAFDPAGKTAEAYRVKGMPSSYLIDENGAIVSSHVGFRGDDKQNLENRIAALLGRKQKKAN